MQDRNESVRYGEGRARSAEREYAYGDPFGAGSSEGYWGGQDETGWGYGASRAAGSPRAYGAVGYAERPGFGSGPHVGAGPKDYHRSDERIREDVCDRLTQHGGIDAHDVEVDVTDGIATLSGTIPDRFMKRMAEDVAEATAGVSDVRNELRIAPHDHDAAADSAPGRPDDDWGVMADGTAQRGGSSSSPAASGSDPST